MITWHWRGFQDLTLQELYDILALRQEVFVIEQNCIYRDLDDKDQHSTHLLGKVNDKLVMYLRVLPENLSYPNAISIGRVVSSPSARGKGYAKAAMAQTFLHYKQTGKTAPIIISAQLYLKEFYSSFGFNAVGEPYDEDGIPHIEMRLDPHDK